MARHVEKPNNEALSAPRKKAVGTELTLENIAHVLALLAEMPDRLEGLVKDARDPRLRQPLRSGERSFVETLAHLIHCEDRISEAIYLALLVNEPFLPEVHPERQWGKLLRSLHAAQWGRRICETGKKRKESVYWQARSMALHELEHLTDLEHKLESGQSVAASGKE